MLVLMHLRNRSGESHLWTGEERTYVPQLSVDALTETGLSSKESPRESMPVGTQVDLANSHRELRHEP